MDTWNLTKKPKTYSEKNNAFSINDAGLTGSLYVKTNRPIFVTLHKAQVQVHQGPQNTTRYTESTRRESEKEPWTHWHKGIS